MIHRFVDFAGSPVAWDLIWHVRRITSGTDWAVARGAGGVGTLAYYLNNSFEDVNEWSVHYLDMSPDRQSYVYTRQETTQPGDVKTELVIGPIDDSAGMTTIAYSPVTGSAAAGRAYMQTVGWSPDSQRVYYLATDNHTDDDFDIRRVDADGTNDTLIHASSLPDFALGTNPRVSPDGTMIAYAVDSDGGSGNRGVWVMNEDGTGNTRIYAGSASFNFPLDFYGWSPDSEWLLFTDQSGSPVTRSTYKIHPDGTGQLAIFADTVAAGNIISMTPVRSQHPLFTTDNSQVAVSRTVFSPVSSAPVLLATDGSESYTALPVGSMGVHSDGPVLNYDGSRAYWVEGGSLDGTWVVSCKIDGTDFRIDDDMTDDSTTPDHDDFEFAGFRAA